MSMQASVRFLERMIRHQHEMLECSQLVFLCQSQVEWERAFSTHNRSWTLLGKKVLQDQTKCQVDECKRTIITEPGNLAPLTSFWDEHRKDAEDSEASAQESQPLEGGAWQRGID